MEKPAGAEASAIIYSLAQTAKLNNLSVFKYLQAVLLYIRTMFLISSIASSHAGNTMLSEVLLPPLSAALAAYKKGAVARPELLPVK